MTAWFRLRPQAGRKRAHLKQDEPSPLGTNGNDDHEDASLREILAEGRLRIFLQPIVSLPEGRVGGFEALARGPSGGPLERPDRLFAAAARAGVSAALEDLCCRRALEAACALLSPQERISINVDPRFVTDPSFRQLFSWTHLRDLGIDPARIVLELTENAIVADFAALVQALEPYRTQGVRLAVDDAGAGYSSLRLIAELQPDYIKIAMALVQGVARQPAKRALVETFVNFANQIGAQVTAEGIEIAEDLEALCRLGVHYGQGYLLGQPAESPAALHPEAMVVLTKIRLQRELEPGGRVPTVGEVAPAAETVPAGTPLAEVLQRLETAPRRVLVVVEGGDFPVGVVSRNHVYKKLATPFGYDLLMKRPVDLVMDRHAPILEGETSLADAARTLARSGDHQLNEYAVIVQRDRYRGLLFARELLEHLARHQIDAARDASPLTGLPGNRAIQAELVRRLRGNAPLTAIYADIDHFKGINDTLGFACGDAVIRILAGALRQAVGQYGHPSDFIGHIGGDDFLILSETPDVPALCEQILDGFEAAQAAQALFPAGFPAPTISLAAITDAHKSRMSEQEVGRLAAAAKRLAKSRPGNTFVVLSAAEAAGAGEPAAVGERAYSG